MSGLSRWNEAVLLHTHVLLGERTVAGHLVSSGGSSRLFVPSSSLSLQFNVAAVLKSPYKQKLIKVLSPLQHVCVL